MGHHEPDRALEEPHRKTVYARTDTRGPMLCDKPGHGGGGICDDVHTRMMGVAQGG